MQSFLKAGAPTVVVPFTLIYGEFVLLQGSGVLQEQAWEVTLANNLALFIGSGPAIAYELVLNALLDPHDVQSQWHTSLVSAQNSRSASVG